LVIEQGVNFAEDGMKIVGNNSRFGDMAQEKFSSSMTMTFQRASIVLRLWSSFPAKLFSQGFSQPKRLIV
jgi:hypothetical protein